MLQSLYDNLTSCYWICFDSSGIPSDQNDASMFGSVIAAELDADNGYARQDASPGGNAAWDDVNKWAEIELLAAQFTTSSGTETVSGFAAVFNGSANAPKIIGSFNAGTNVITCTGHGLTDGDRIQITADTGGSLDTGFTATTRYYANAIDANTFEAHTNVGLSAIVDIQGDGSGTHRLRYSNGDGMYVTTINPAITITTSASVDTISGAKDTNGNG